MPSVTLPTNGNGSLRPFTDPEVAAFGLDWRGVRDGSTPTMAFETNANRCEAKIWCNWNQFQNVVVYLLGTSVLYSDSGTTRISRLLPYPLPGRPGLVATKVLEVNGHKFTGLDEVNFPKYGKAEMRVLWESPSYKIFADGAVTSEAQRFVEYTPGDTRTEVISVYGGAFNFYRDPLKPNPTSFPNGNAVPWPAVNKRWPLLSFTTTWWRLPEGIYDPSVATGLFLRVNGDGEQGTIPLAGAINKTPIFGFKPGTVALQQVREVRDKSPIGDGSYDIRLVMNWEYNGFGWNKLYSANGASAAQGFNGWYFVGNKQFRKAGTVPQGESLWDEVDFAADLFRP